MEEEEEEREEMAAYLVVGMGMMACLVVVVAGMGMAAYLVAGVGTASAAFPTYEVVVLGMEHLACEMAALVVLCSFVVEI